MRARRIGLLLLLLACAACGNDPEAVRRALREARTHAEAGRWEAAEAAYRRALAANPYLPDVNRALGEVLAARLERPEEAAGYYRRAARLAGPQTPAGRAALEKAGALEAVAAGRLVRPADAVEHLLWCAGRGNAWLFAGMLDGVIARRLRAADRDADWLLAHWREHYAARERRVLRSDVAPRTARVRLAFAADGDAPPQTRDFYLRRTDGGDWRLVGFRTVEDDG